MGFAYVNLTCFNVVFQPWGRDPMWGCLEFNWGRLNVIDRKNECMMKILFETVFFTFMNIIEFK